MKVPKIPQIEIDWHEHEKNVVRNEANKKIKPPKPGSGCLPFYVVPVLAFIGMLLAFCSSAQIVRPSDHADFLTLSVGTLGEQYVRYEHDVTDKYILLQASAYAGVHGYGIQYKLGAGYAPKGSKVRAYIFLPYFNMNFSEKGYNTPFAAEIFLDQGRFQGSVNFDVYPLGVLVVPSARIRYRFAKYRF